jgi:hypothetical protein
MELLGPTDTGGAQDPNYGTTLPANQWISYSATTSTAVTASHVGLFWLPNNFAGTIYMDRVRLSM